MKGFTEHGEWPVAGDVAASFLRATMADLTVKRLLSTEHFSVDGTLIDAWASMKGFRPKDGRKEPLPGTGRNAGRDFRGEKRSSETHTSTNDQDARLCRKSNGQSSRLCLTSHLLIENRHGPIVDAPTTHATGRARDGRGNERGGYTQAPGRRWARTRLTMPPGTWPGSRDRGDATRRPAHIRAAVSHRWADDAPCRASDQPTPAQAHGGIVGLDQVGCRIAQDPASRASPGGLDVHPYGCGQHFGAPAQAIGERKVTKCGASAVLGRWRIVEIKDWDNDHIDMLGPGHIQFDRDGGHLEFGAIQIGLDCWYNVSVTYSTRLTS